jgi:hypothetical protein
MNINIIIKINNLEFNPQFKYKTITVNSFNIMNHMIVTIVLKTHYHYKQMQINLIYYLCHHSTSVMNKIFNHNRYL